MKTRYFELVKGTSRKFWEIGLDGGAIIVRFGRIGSPGQKKIVRAPDARAAMEKLITEKTRKGYREKNATKSTPSAPVVQPALVSQCDEGFVGVWPRGKDLWIMGISDAPKKLEDDATFASVLEDDGTLERWQFATPKDAQAAVRALKAERRKPVKLPAWAETDFAMWERKLSRKVLQRIPRFAVSKSGPVSLHRHVRHPWVHPRPPSRCAICQRVLVPTWSLVGPLDPRLGKRTHVLVSFCPGGLDTPDCEAPIEVVIQSPDDKKPRAEHYFFTADGFYVITTSVQWDPIDGSPMFVLNEHFGAKTTPGTLRSKTFTSRAALQKAEAEALAATDGYHAGKPQQFRGWYDRLLDEMHEHHRHPKASPKSIRLAPSIPAMRVRGSPYAWSRELFEEIDGVGGNPAYTQSEPDATFPCPDCKTDMLYVFQAGCGAPWWSDMVNDGDAGSFQFFACPKCRGPFGFALFECH